MKCHKCGKNFEDEIGSILFLHEKKALCGECSRWYRESLSFNEDLFTKAFLDPNEDTICAYHRFKAESSLQESKKIVEDRLPEDPPQPNQEKIKCDICKNSDAFLMDFKDHVKGTSNNYCYHCYLYSTFRTQMHITRNMIDFAQHYQQLCVDNGIIDPKTFQPKINIDAKTSE